jgi:hypothetical protein
LDWLKILLIFLGAATAQFLPAFFVDPADQGVAAYLQLSEEMGFSAEDVVTYLTVLFTAFVAHILVFVKLAVDKRQFSTLFRSMDALCRLLDEVSDACD